MDPKLLSRVRRVVSAHVRRWGRSEVVPAVAMCITEMLTNVHHHAGGTCVLLLEATPDGVRVTISDTSRELPQVRQPDWSSESGRGMWLVSRTAHAWGARATPTGKDVWAELRPTGTAEKVAA